MGFEFKLPDIGEGVMEGEIVQWLVKTGDAVDMDQPLVEVMTDKATVVIPSPKRGKVVETRGSEGEVVAVGAVIVVLEVAAGASPEEAAEPDLASVTQLATTTERSSVLAAPATRRLARKLGLDISKIKGSGPSGRVLASDVEAASARSAHPEPASLPASATSQAPPAAAFRMPPPATTAAPMEQDSVQPVRGVRGKIWDSMTRSAFTAPHFTFVEACDVTELQNQRKRFNAGLPAGEAALTFLPFIIKACCFALREMPQLNGHVDNENRSFTQRADKHIGIAVAADQGLTVPVVRHADRRTLVDLGTEVKRLADSVRTGRIATQDLGGSTFTVTSLGKEGGLFATPIINHPEVGILGVHRLQKQFHPDSEGRPVLREVMNLSLSADHRLIDGHIAARFCYRVIELLQHPEKLFMMMA